MRSKILIGILILVAALAVGTWYFTNSQSLIKMPTQTSDDPNNKEVALTPTPPLLQQELEEKYDLILKAKESGVMADVDAQTWVDTKDHTDQETLRKPALAVI